MQPTIRRYRADLHVHTTLSPCASETMRPPAILAAAAERGIDLIGILDHNAAGNARALTEAAAGGAVHILPGLEVQSVEGVHLVCLCDTADAAEAMQEFVWAHLPQEGNPPDVIGRQRLLNADGEQVGHERRPLWQPTGLGLAGICREAERRGLLVIPAHVSRQGTGLLAVLGSVPDGLEIDALECDSSLALNAEAAAGLAGYGRVCSSDAHRPEEIGTACTDFWLGEPTVAELRLALGARCGRSAAEAGTDV